MTFMQSIQGFRSAGRWLSQPIRTGSALLAMLLLLAGCSVTPVYDRPAVDVPAAYKEAAQNATQDATQAAAANLAGAQSSQWQAARPDEAAARGAWWMVFNDDDLNVLEDRAQQAN